MSVVPTKLDKTFFGGDAPTGRTVAFTRRADGSVVISTGPDGAVLGIDAWAQAVAYLSAQGAAPERVGLIRNFHMYEPAGVDANGSPVEEGKKPT